MFSRAYDYPMRQSRVRRVYRHPCASHQSPTRVIILISPSSSSSSSHSSSRVQCRVHARRASIRTVCTTCGICCGANRTTQYPFLSYPWRVEQRDRARGDPRASSTARGPDPRVRVRLRLRRRHTHGDIEGDTTASYLVPIAHAIDNRRAWVWSCGGESALVVFPPRVT